MFFSHRTLQKPPEQVHPSLWRPFLRHRAGAQQPPAGQESHLAWRQVPTFRFSRPWKVCQFSCRLPTLTSWEILFGWIFLSVFFVSSYAALFTHHIHTLETCFFFLLRNNKRMIVFGLGENLKTLTLPEQWMNGLLIDNIVSHTPALGLFWCHNLNTCWWSRSCWYVGMYAIWPVMDQVFPECLCTPDTWVGTPFS